MPPDIFNQSVTRLFIMEADRVLPPDSARKPIAPRGADQPHPSPAKRDSVTQRQSSSHSAGHTVKASPGASVQLPIQRSSSFLVGAIDFHMILDYISCIGEIPAGRAGSREILLLGYWGRTDKLRCLSVDVQISHGGGIRFVSRTTEHKTAWVGIYQLAAVFEAPARAHVVLGSESFVKKKGQSIAARLKLRLPQYVKVASRLKKRIPKKDDVLPMKLVFAGIEVLPDI